jgi:WD40 repeat protein/serine/threonine protein kinase
MGHSAASRALLPSPERIMPTDRSNDVTKAIPAGPAGSLPPGFELGPYRIKSVIAAGGFGITYLGEHVSLGKQVAIKEHFPREFAQRDGVTVRPTASDADVYKWGLSRFLEEARSLARFRHSAIVNVENILEANGTAYMVLAYEDGRDMGRWLQRIGRPPTQEEMDSIAIPLLEALELVHGEGLLHRDIAPDNVIIRRNISPVLIDFGSARSAVGVKTRTMFATVKKGYSPPEQYVEDLKGQGPWTDIYALAATFYRSVTGQTPQESTDRMLDDQLRPAIHLAPPGYRPEFLSAIDAALRVRPKDRPQSVGAWRQMLLAVGAPPTQLAPKPLAAAVETHIEPRANASPLPAAPIAPPQVVAAPRPARRSGWLGLIAASIVLGAAVGGGAWWWTNHGSPERVAERELAAIVTTLDPEPYEKLAEKHKGTRAADAARAKAVEIRRSNRHATAARLYETRIKSSTNEAEIERFITEHGDAPSVTDARTRLAEVRKQKQLQAETERQRRVRFEAAAAEWSRIKASIDETEIERFIANYSDTPAAADARARLASLRADIEREWRRLESSQDIAGLEQFIAKYPSSRWRSSAETQLAALKRQRQVALDGEARRNAAATEWARLRRSSDEAALERFIAAYPELALALEARNRLLEVRRLKSTAAAEWERLKTSSDPGHIERFIDAYKDLPIAEEARTRLAAIRKEAEQSPNAALDDEAWQRAIDDNTIGGFKAYLKDYPRGRHVGNANEQIEARERSGRVIKTFTGHTRTVLAVAFLPDGRRAVSAGQDNLMKLWDLSQSRESRILKGHRSLIRGLAVSPDGKLAATGSTDSTIKIWNLETGQEVRTLRGHTDAVRSVAFSRDGRLLLSGSNDGTVRLWDIASGQLVRSHTGHNGGVEGLAFLARDTAFASAGHDQTVRIWSLADGRLTRTLAGHSASVEPLAAAADFTTNALATTFVTGGHDGLALIWSSADSRPRHTLKGHEGSIWAVAITRDGRLALTAGNDLTIRLWDAATGKELKVFRGHSGPVLAVAFSPDGRFMITGSQDNTVKLWDLTGL